MRPGPELLELIKPGWADEARVITQGRAFRRILGGSDPMQGRCLNAGCGEGLYSEFLESFQGVTEIVGIDLHPASVTTRRSDSKHVAVAGSLTALPFADSSFDCCLCSEVIEHIEQDTLAASELARVLKPGGLLLVSVPTPPAPFDRAHVREGYTLEALSDLLGKSGVTVTRHAYCCHFLMRVFYVLWGWQCRAFGKGTRSYLPRFLVRLFGHADRQFRVGRPWDLVVLARK